MRLLTPTLQMQARNCNVLPCTSTQPNKTVIVLNMVQAAVRYFNLIMLYYQCQWILLLTSERTAWQRLYGAFEEAGRMEMEDGETGSSSNSGSPLYMACDQRTAQLLFCTSVSALMISKGLGDWRQCLLQPSSRYHHLSYPLYPCIPFPYQAVYIDCGPPNPSHLGVFLAVIRPLCSYEQAKLDPLLLLQLFQRFEQLYRCITHQHLKCVPPASANVIIANHCTESWCGSLYICIL